MDDLAQREEERRKRREERERAKKAEEEAWEAERKKREEERKARRETRLKGESVEAEPKPKMTDIIEREEEEKRKALEEEKKKRVEEANALAESRKKAPVQETPQPQPVKKDEPKVEIKPRIEKLEKITKGEEEEHEVKPTVNVKLETKDLNIKPTIEYMEKISSPRSNTADPVSPRKKEESPRPSATTTTTPAPVATSTTKEKEDSDDDDSSYTSSSSVSSDSEDDVDDKKKPDTTDAKKLAAEQEIKKVLEEEEKKLKAKEEAEKKAKEEEEEKKKKLALEEEEKKKKLALEEEEKKKKLALEEEKKKKAQAEEEEKKKKLALEEEEKKKKEEEEKKKKLALEEEEKKKKLAAEEEEKKRRAKEEEEKKRKLEEEKKKTTSATPTSTTTPTPTPAATNATPELNIVIEEDKEEDFTLYKKLSEKELQALENSYSQRKIAENAKKEPQQTAFYATNLSEFFHSFTSLCRDISSQYDIPELVFIGSKGQGKSNLVASILGVPLSYDTLEKPIYFHLLSDPNVAKYSYSIENTNKPGDYSTFNNVSEFQNKLKESIKEKGKSSSINVKISSSLIGFNIILIDTPYLHHVHANDKLVLDLIKDQSRTIIYVKEATVEKDHNFLLELKQLLNSVDPKFSRTILVNTKLDNTLKLRLLPNQINDALESSLKFSGNTFWVSALTTEATSSIKTEEEYKERLNEIQKIDIKILESLRYNKRVTSIGLSLLRSHLLNLCWNQYKVNIPKMQQKNKDSINKLLNSQRTLNSQLEKLTTDKLRFSINNYYHSFLIQLKKLLEGNEKVQSPMLGQTLNEEYSQNGFYWEVPDYLDSSINSTSFQEKVPLYSSRLNGAHQFKRLLSEFQLVLEQIKLPHVSVEDIVCAGAGVLQSSNSSFLYAACEFTRSEAYSLLQPLVIQLAERAVNILKRQTHVVDSILRSNDSPYLISYLDSIFHTYFEEMRRNFLNKINEEFYSTATLYWSSLLNDKDASDQDIEQYSNNLFSSIKNHIATKSLLLLTNYFVFTILENSDSLENLQLKLFKLSDQDITELFQVTNTKSNLLQEDNDITEKVKVLESFNQQISNKLVYWPKAS